MGKFDQIRELVLEPDGTLDAFAILSPAGLIEAVVRFHLSGAPELLYKDDTGSFKLGTGGLVTGP
jgi:hypothetical protein